MRFLLASLSTAALCGCAHHAPAEGHGHAGHAGHGMPHRFANAEEWAGRFEDPARDAWQQPDKVLEALALAPDAVVADIGAATGYFPVRVARAVPKGRVYGVDVEQSMVDYLAARAKQEGLTNLTALQCAPDDARLPEPVDVVMVVDTFHHIDAREAYFQRLLGKLKPGGRVVIIDFRKGQPMGPPEEHRIDAAQVKRELAAAGYALAAEHTFLPNQHFLVFSKKP